MKKENKMKSKIVYPLIGILAGALTLVSLSFGLFSGLENFFEDLLFSQKPISDKIVIVAVDDESIKRIGQWPWPREIFAKALLKINENPPLVLGIDVMFSEPSRLGEKDDEILSEALEKISFPVILPVEASPLLLDKNEPPLAINFLKPLDLFQSQKQVSLGTVNLISDRDNLVRTFPLKISEKNGKEIYFSFAYQAVKQSRLPIPRQETLSDINRIVYSSPAGFIRKIPFWRILEESDSGELKDKIVFLGATAPDLQDASPIPFSKGKEMPGVEIHSQIANMLLEGYRLLPLEKKLSFLWIIFAGFLPSLLFILSKSNLKTFSFNLLLGAGHLIAVIVLFQKGISANLVHINFSWVLSASALFGWKFFITEKERRETRNLFSKYVSKDVLEEILKNPSKVALGGEEKEITVLFCDIRGFTSLSENLSPPKLVNFLNRYFSLMSKEILEKGGVLDKYIGDAIMAFWGAPIEDSEQADKALQASLEMLKELEKFNQELREEQMPEINIGIGLYTGPAVVGNIGSATRFDYTVIGDTVNAASRLEGLTKEYKVKIVIGESAKNKLRGEYPLKFLGTAQVKGKTKPINIYTI